MLEVVMNWMTNHWLELASLVIASAALYYAALAYQSSKDTATHAKASELTNLRIQAKSGLVDAKRSYSALRSSCQVSRTDWERYARKHLPMLVSRPDAYLSTITKVEREGAALLQRVTQYDTTVEGMNVVQLEKLLQYAKTTALEIEGLTVRLEQPATHFN